MDSLFQQAACNIGPQKKKFATTFFAFIFSNFPCNFLLISFIYGISLFHYIYISSFLLFISFISAYFLAHFRYSASFSYRFPLFMHIF